MSKNTLISTGAVIAQVFRNFKPTNNGWDVDAIEWIGEALAIMNMHVQYTKTSKVVQVKDHRYLLPCSLQALLGVEYKCCRLPYKGTLKLFKEEDQELCNKPSIPNAHYTLNTGAIHTSFAEGEITIYYNTLPVDCHGYPLVVNNQKLKTALTWYILMQYLARGGTHPTFKYADAEARWEIWWVRARNSVNFPDLERAWAFKDHWISIIPEVNREVDFFTDDFVVPPSENGDISDFTGTSINPNIVQ